jgi:hypothetical protein
MFLACSHSHKKLVLPLSCPSVCLSIWLSVCLPLSACISVASTGWIAVKYLLGTSQCQEIQIWLKLDKKKTSTSDEDLNTFYCANNINLP